MTGILMGHENSHGKPFVLVMPDVSVYSPAMSDSLILVGCLIKAGFTNNHRTPSQANEDGLSLKAFRAISDSLILVGRLIKAGFTVNHRTPSQANEDGFSNTPSTHGIFPCHLTSASQN